MPYKDPQKEKEAKRASYLRHKEKNRLKNREWKRRHKELLRERERGPTKKCARCGQKPWAAFKDGRAQVCEDCRHKTPEWLVKRRQARKPKPKKVYQKPLNHAKPRKASSTDLSPQSVRSVSSDKVSQTAKTKPKPKKLNKKELEVHVEAEIFDREMRRMKREALKRLGLTV